MKTSIAIIASSRSAQSPPPENLLLKQRVSTRRRWHRTPLAWLFAAFALSCLAPANAIAQTTPPAILDLGTVDGFRLNLILPVTTTSGKTYYFLDASGDGIASLSADLVTLSPLSTLLNNGTVPMETQLDGHNGRDDERSVIVDSHTLVLPTAAEYSALHVDQGSNPPTGWRTTIEYMTSNVSPSGQPTIFGFGGLNGVESVESASFRGYVAFQVLPKPPPTFGADTIPNQTYLGNANVNLTLPDASSGSGTLSYTLTDASTVGLAFDSATRILSGTTPTTPTTTTLTYTATDTAADTASLVFTVTVVAVAGDGTAAYSDGALAVNDVGGANNDMRLILPPGNSVSDVAVTFYDPSTSTIAVPDGVTFSGVAMDIALTPALPTNTPATVCLSTVGATGRPALYHLSASPTAWEAIGSETGRFPGFVCGTTTAFSPFAVGSLEIEDARLSAISQVILPEVARAITDTIVSAIARRLHHAGADSRESGSVTLGGQSTLADILTTGGQALANGTLNLHNMVGRSAFVLPLNQAGDLVKGLTLWGGGDYRAIGGNGDATDWDGALFSARLGADARVRANLLTGAALSWTQGDFEYGALADDPTAGGGDYTLRMTSLTPYVGWSVVPAGGLDVWATAGYGWGEVSITDTLVDARQTSDATTVMVGGGVSAQVLKTRTSRVRVKGELMQTSMDLDGHDRIGALTVEARRARLQVEGRHEYELAGGGRLGGTLEAGLRRDGGDGLTGTGAEMGGGVQYRHPTQGVTLSGQGRVLLGHTSNYEDWGIGAALTVIPGKGGEGLALRLSPTYGQTVTNTAQLWDQSAANLTGTDAAVVGQRMNAEVGYGLAIADGQSLLTPYGKLTWGQGTRDYRLGSRLTLASGLNLSLESRRGEIPGAAADHGVLLKVEWGW